MQAALEASKTAAGRQELLAAGEVRRAAERAVHLLPTAAAGAQADQQQEDLLVLLRLLRNCCAAGAAAAAALLECGVPHPAVAFAAASAAAPPTAVGAQQQQSLLLAAVQLLANLSAASQEAAAAVWAAMFPAQLEAVLSWRHGSSVHEAAALATLACVRSCQAALTDLTSPAAQQVWRQLLAPMQQQQEQQADGRGEQAPPSAPHPANDNVCLLVKFVALQEGRLQQVMECLGDKQQRQQQQSFNEAQAVLLHIVAVELAAVPIASPLPGLQAAAADAAGSQQAPDAGACAWLQYAVSLLRTVWRQAAADAPVGAGVCSAPTPAAHVLEATLQVLKAVLAREEEVAASGGNNAKSSSSSGRDVKAAAAAGIAAAARLLDGLGLVPLLLDMLRALGAPPKSKQQQQRELEQQQQAPQQPPPPQPPQHLQPYAGYRSDVIAVLSNLLFEQRGVQDTVLAAGGVELLLNNCNLDESSPLAREWALWAVRNLCQGNEAVQAHVAQFQAVAPVQTAELDAMGMQLELDGLTHKLQLVKKPGQEPTLTAVQQPDGDS